MTIKNTDDLLEHARLAFRQAAEMKDIAGIWTYVEIGLSYLRMAHEDAAVFDASEDREPARRNKSRVR
jgi:hypothetical protein